MNLSQFSILMEMLGATLIAYDIFPESWRKAVKKAVTSWVWSGNRSKMAILATVISMLIVLGWALITDLRSGQDNTRTYSSLLFMLIGVFGGIAVPLMVTQFSVLLLDIFTYMLHRPHVTADSGTIIYIITLFLSVVGLYGFASAASLSLVSLVSFFVTFIITVAFLGAWINAVPLLQRLLRSKGITAGRIGIVVFIIAKIIQYGLEKG